MFERGREYLRSELLDFVGSRQGQTGIIWGNAERGCIVCTSGGRHSGRAGYGDEQLVDGTWYYFGQGAAGDQDSRTKANDLLLNGQRTILLFTAREPSAAERREHGSYAKHYKFQGAFQTGSWEWVIPSNGKRAGNRLIRAHLFPSSSYARLEAVSVFRDARGLADVREELAQLVTGVSVGTLAPAEYYRRSALTVEYALRRAAGICELCGKPSPFTTSCGAPFLEVHHLVRLADGGPDLPCNVAGVCPNCHRAIHLSSDRGALSNRLRRVVEEKEGALGRR